MQRAMLHRLLARGLKDGPNARYRINPATVHVDLWQLRDLIQQARIATAPERTGLLRQACDLYTAPLAGGCHYEWIEPHRRPGPLMGPAVAWHDHAGTTSRSVG